MTATQDALTDAIVSTDLPLPGRRAGKVRDVYRLPAAPGVPPRVVIVATDRLSAFDVVLPTPIPGKGRLLTAIAEGWFRHFRPRRIIGDHLLSTDPADVPGLSAADRARLRGRVMVGRAAEVIPIECVARGYLAGSGWSDYQKTGAVCGVALPRGLERCGRLPEPIFTPATKATEGHDENIDFAQACAIAGADVMRRLRDVTLRLYAEAAEYAATRGIILADTKLEFGYAIDARAESTPQAGLHARRGTDEIILIDEIFTPDSSRFWPADHYAPGREQESFDKQYVRNYLLELVEQGKWDKSPPGPALPDAVVRNTLARYREAYERLFGG
jgi:phosphoribosylaminoimidazole-succinocarboxamide synthase